MNDPVFASMRSQMTPSQKARSELADKLAQAAPGRPVFWRRCAAVAACAALALCIYPVYNALKPAPVLHGYVTVEGGDALGRKEITTITGTGENGVEGDHGVAPNTGDLPGGAYVPGGDDPVPGVPAQPGADAYQLLMDHFGDALPDWYGGAYVTSRGTLMVLLVNGKDPGDKTLELEVLEAVGGRTAPVGFEGVKYSRNELDRLNGEILALLDGKGIQASWGIYEDQNRIVLDTSEVLPDELLAKLAELDPEGDAILVRVVTGSTTVNDQSVKGPAPIEPGGVQEAPPYSGTVGEDPAEHFATEPGAVAPDDEDLKAMEPQLDEGPEPGEKSGTESGQAVSHTLPTPKTEE